PASSVGGYILARLDLNFIRDEFIPTLVARYFQTGTGLDYLVMIASREQKDRVIYKSSPAATTEMLSTSDGSIGIFAVRPEEYGNVIAERLESRKETDGDAVVRGDQLTMRVVTRPTGARLPAGMNVVVSEMDGYWQIFLKHRAGSLEAAVASVRRRSVALSLGVLGLLSASIILLLFSTRRAQRLAEQQMDFVAGVSHELRTPLAVIRSAAENLADGCIGTPEHIQRYGALIRDEGRRLTDMVEQVLEVAGVQSGRRSYQLRPVHPSRIIEQAVIGSNLLITENGFEIDVRADEQVPLIGADAAALGRALQNLISNAIKYSGDNRRISIRSSSHKREGRDEVRIEIEDFGIGISAHDLPHIFEPFYRGRDVIAAQIHGSGLGLSLVKHIIESHGGRITAESSLGRGTLFTLYLPAVDANRSVVSIAEGYEQTYPAH
ncbi:MAG: ATP-binding protein, partial [Acidobacteriota bacterium]